MGSRAFVLVGPLLAVISVLSAQPAQKPATAKPSAKGSAPAHLVRIALVPLDDRPINLQDIQLLGAVADADVVSPPRHRLGRFTTEGDADGIAEWLDGLDLTKLDAVIVSTDMLAYGGQIASRRPTPSREKALRRWEALGRLKARRKDVRVYAFSTLLPLDPPDDGRKGKWKETLLQWAELGGSNANDPQAASEAQRLEAEIPPTMIELYRTVRARNLAVTESTLDLVSKGGADAVVISAGGAPRGLAFAERNNLTERVSRSGVSSQVHFVTNADSVALLLLARAVADVTSLRPGVVVDAEETTASDLAASYLQVAGAQRVEQAGSRDMTWVIADSPADDAGAARVVGRVAALVSAGRRVALADIAPADGVGASVPLVESLRNKHLFARLASYAGGPRAAVLASSLTQGLLRTAAVTRVLIPDAPLQSQLDDAQIIAVLHHLVVDFAYQAVVRPQAVTDYLEAHAIDPAHLDADQEKRVESYLIGEIKPLAENLVGDLDDQPVPTRGPRKIVTPKFRNLENFKLGLPWGRLDEIEISFVLK